jgi:tetratricopeptide (TPR) repeat protein
MPANLPPADTSTLNRNPSRHADWLGLAGAAILIIGAIAVYSRTFSVPLLADDTGSIADNPTIRHLWPIWPVLSPPSGGVTVSGRPVLNLTLAVNYALGGTQVWGYHAVNLAIHILAGLTLFGIARRMFRTNSMVAFAIALLWTLHPLQTESVTYIVQRAESLMGLFYLLTLYCFIRHAEVQSDGSTKWLFAAFSVICCLLGMATKEVMVSAPVVVLLYDRTFLAGSFREALRRRSTVYLGLASTWILLGYLVIREGGNRSGSIGFGMGASWWAYGLTQFQAIARYLRLAVWPHPLVFEYGTTQVTNAWQVIPFACLVVPLAAATVLALWRWPAWGFLGFWFFAILAPTSLISGATQTISEHRMYLALAPVLMAILGGGCARMQRGLGAKKESANGVALAQSVVLIALAGACGFLTVRRNEAYRSALSIWSDTVAKQPDNNAVARNNLGTALAQTPGRIKEAIAQFEDALRERPDYAEAHYNLGSAFSRVPGRQDDSIAQYEDALRLKTAYAETQKDFAEAKDDFAKAHNNLGLAWSNRPGRSKEAIAQYEEALRIKPDSADAHKNLAASLFSAGRLPEAIAHYRTAVRLQPADGQNHLNLGLALTGTGSGSEAIEEFTTALRLNPNLAEAAFYLGVALVDAHRLADGIASYERAIAIRPEYAVAHNNLGVTLSNAGRMSESLPHYREAIRINPGYFEAHCNLGYALSILGRTQEAIASFQEAVRLAPANTAARNALGNELYSAGRIDEAVDQFTAVIRLNSRDADAHNNLGICRAAERQFDQALAEFEAAVRLRPDFAAAEINWGHCLQAQGKTGDALAHLRRGAQLQAAAGH